MMIKPLKNPFVEKVKSELKVFTKNETYINNNDPLGILIQNIFQTCSLTRGGNPDDINKSIKKIINDQLLHLENMIVEHAIKYEAVILDNHNVNIDPQKFIDYIQQEAEALSFELYSEDDIKILRNFHIYYLTYVKASNSLIKARINKAHNDLQKIAEFQKFRGDPLEKKEQEE